MTRPGGITLDILLTAAVIFLIPVGAVLLPVVMLGWGVWQLLAWPLRRLARVRRVRRLWSRLTARRDARRCAEHGCVVCQLAAAQPSARQQRLYNGSRR